MITADDAKIAAIDVLDVRFPTSRLLDGLVAMNPDPVVIDGRRYRVLSRPGCGAQMEPETLSRFAFFGRGGVGPSGRSSGLISCRPRESWAVAADRLDP